MNESELRALVRNAIARHTLVGGGAAERAVGVADALDHARAHSSHAMFRLVAGGEGDGPCLIEPAVRCSHCGYCRSYGH